MVDARGTPMKEEQDRVPPESTSLLMSRSPLFTHDLPAGPPPEVLDEIDAAWERAQALVDIELHFEVDTARPHRAHGELRRSDGTLERRLTATEAVAIACGDPVELVALAV
jgi:hypothetical protein